MPAMGFSPRKIVVTHAQHAGEQLQLGSLFRILARARVGGNRLAANLGQLAIFAQFVD